MSIPDYVRMNSPVLVCYFTVLLLINTVLLSSVPLGAGLVDIVYLNVLLIAAQFSFFTYGYVKQRKAYADFLGQHRQRHNDDQSSQTNGGARILEPYLSAMTLLLDERTLNWKETEEGYRQKMNETQDFMTQWAHDIKVNLAVCDLLCEEQAVSLDMRVQLEQIKLRINQVLQITRANHYQEDFIAEEVDISQQLRAAIKANALFFIHKNIEIETELTPFTIISDRKWVHDIFCQLIHNSSKYTENGGRLLIVSDESDYAYRVCIRDNGVGIPVEDLPRLFDKGFTGRNGRHGIKSTGMGLYYAKKMADRLRIGIEADSKDGDFTEFTLTFYKLSDYYDVARSQAITVVSNGGSDEKEAAPQ